MADEKLSSATRARGNVNWVWDATNGVWRKALCDESGNILAKLVTGTSVIGSVKITDGTNFMPTMDVVARAGYTYVTDGTNTMPTMDATTRAGYTYVTDGTNTMPTMDVNTRKGFFQITDGTNNAECTNEALQVVIRDDDGNVNVQVSDTISDAFPATDYGLFTISYLLGFNGTTWDRLRSDSNKYLYTTIGVQLPSGTNYIGKVRQTDGTNDITLKSHGSDSTVVLPVTPYSNDSSFIVHLNAENVGAVTKYILIDISDTSNWPHAGGTVIHIDFIAININPGSSFAGDVDIGFLSDVDGTNGDFNSIQAFHLDRAGLEIVAFEKYSPESIIAAASAWFGPTTADDTDFNTGNNLVGPDGNDSYPSGNGDLALIINRTAGNVDVAITVGYHTA